MNKTKQLDLLILLFLSIWLQSCDAFEPSPDITQEGDYFPVSNNIEKFYLRESFNPPVPVEPFYKDTIKVYYRRDTTIGSRIYKQLDFYGATNNQRDLFRLFRKEGSKYFASDYSDTTESLFLDTGKGTGSSWSNYRYDREFKTTFTILAVNATRIVNGVKYQNVIEVRENNFGPNRSCYDYVSGSYVLVSSTQHLYAKDFGEIVSSTESFFYKCN